MVKSILDSIVSFTSHGSLWFLYSWSGLRVERVNDTFNVDLDIVRGLYRFDNGVTVGTVVMFGYVDYLDVPDEGRYEAIIGYSPTLSSSRISPYAFITKGVRSYFGVDSSIHYHTATFGNRYILNERIYLDSLTGIEIRVI